MADRIVSLECFAVAPRWVFLKITTADGLTGWGEPVVEGKALTVMQAVDEFSDALIGHDPDRIEDIFQMLYRGSFYRGGPVLMSAISGIDQALWDIKGKRLGVPVYELFGGAVRDRMQAYSWVGGDQPEETAAAAKRRVEAGWKAVKLNGAPRVGWFETPASIEGIVAEVTAVRDAVGWDVGIGLDFHGRVHKGLAKTLIKELEPLKPMFIEEPVVSEQIPAMAELARQTSIPIATGERLYGRWGFRPLLESGCVDIIQPDLSHAGGVSEVRRIAAMAEAYDVAVAPHAPLGPINLAASLQLDFCTPNAVIQETSLGIHYHEGGPDLLDYVIPGTFFELKNGFFERNSRPGLGVEINEDAVREAAKQGHRWRNPLWRQPDGSVAEW
jgi:galactonate dehydratase